MNKYGLLQANPGCADGALSGLFSQEEARPKKNAWLVATEESTPKPTSHCQNIATQNEARLTNIE